MTDPLAGPDARQLIAAAGYMAGWEDRTEPAVPALSPRRRAPWRASADRTVRRPR